LKETGMMESVSPYSATTPAASSRPDANKLMDVDINDFMTLMIAELQNQDPLDPMKNSEMLQQLSHIRSIGSTDQLTQTLEAMLIGQNLTTAGSLIGKEVTALTDQGLNIQGLVDRVTAAAGERGSRSVRLHIGEHSVSLQNIREIAPNQVDS
jgi:flagellar basal-body rod modification protein FlgD